MRLPRLSFAKGIPPDGKNPSKQRKSSFEEGTIVVNLWEVKGLELFPLLEEAHWDFRISRALQVANALGLFTTLAERSLSARELSAELGTDEGYTERLLIVLCALGLLEKVEGRYRNTLLAETFLVRGAPLYQGDAIAHAANVWDFWHRLEAVVRTGRREASLAELPPPPPQAAHECFIRAMHNLSITGSAQMVAQTVDLSSARRLLDVGGGPGTYSIAFCQRYPHLECVVFDLPQTLEIAREVVAQFGLSHRIHLQPGDWNRDEFGEDFDAVLLSNVLHGPGSQAPMKLAKAHRALKPGGWLLAHDFLLNAQKTGPLQAALFNLMVGAYSEPELRAELEAAGFVEVRLMAYGRRGNALMVGRKP